MAWKASSTPLFVVWVLQKHGNLARPAQHATPTFLFLTASTFHEFHKPNLQKSVLIGTCGTITCTPSVAQDNPAGTFQYDVLWCCKISSLMQMVFKKMTQQSWTRRLEFVAKTFLYSSFKKFTPKVTKHPERVRTRAGRGLFSQWTFSSQTTVTNCAQLSSKHQRNK